MHPIITDHKDEIFRICEASHVANLYFFGSVIDAERFSDSSDVDILVSFVEDISMDTYAQSYFQLLFDLEDLLKRRIDITTERSLTKPYFMEELDNTKLLFYSSLVENNG